MQLLLGDPCFKTPPSNSKLNTIMGSEDSLEPDCKGDAGRDCETQTRRRPNSLRLPKCRSLIMGSGICEDSDSAATTPEDSACGQRARSSTSSFGSQYSKISGYSSEHSRCTSLSEPTRRRKLSSSSSGFSSGPSSAADIEDRAKDPTTFEKPPLPLRPSDRSLRRKNWAPESYPSWVNDTRVNADDIVERIVQTQDFTVCSDSEESGLQLFVGRDGSTLVEGVQLSNRRSVSDYMPVVIGSY
ncbi:early estrogen-induced gene 1 protein-like [Cetorhinus maximus]